MALFPSLTCRLLTALSYAWRQLTDAEVEARLASPTLHGAALSGVMSLWASLVTTTNLNFRDAICTTLEAMSCSIGAAALALAVVPAYLRGLHVDQRPALRYASMTALPLGASGCSLLLPDRLTSLIAVAPLCALAYLSGLRGSDTFLALRRAGKTRAAASASLAPTLPALLLAPVHAAR